MNFSELVPSVLDPLGRQRVARQILAILNDHYQYLALIKLTALDIGCSSGSITDFLAPHFKSITGIDIDTHVLPHKPNYFFMDATRLKFPDRSFDVVVCNQVYYWFKNPDRLISEIYRALRPGGTCIFINVNKYVLFEPQYRKVLISFLPRSLALFIEPRYDCYYLSYWELEKLCSKFIIHHYTPQVLNNPRKYNFTRLYKLPSFLRRLIPEPFSSNIIWLLEKPQ